MGTERRKNILAQAQQAIVQQLKLNPQSLVVIVGPTASGKTQLALDLAQYFPLEIVSADSRLVYREMDIGTAKPSQSEQGIVPHHLIDLVAPDENFTLADYQAKAYLAIDEIFAYHKLPILVGGTMLYIDTVVYNYELPQHNERSGPFVRDWPLEKLQATLKDLNSTAENKLDWKNPVRLTRALEFYYATGEWIWEKQRKGKRKYSYVLLGIDINRDVLKQRIFARVKQQISSGLIDEVETLVKKYPNAQVAMTGIGYRQVLKYLQGKNTLEEMQNQIITDTLAYAKRQMTWWRRNQEIIWLPVAD